MRFPLAYGNRIDLAKDLSGTVDLPVIMAELTYSAWSVPLLQLDTAQGSQNLHPSHVMNVLANL